jgi:hypothetical protein
LEKVLNREESLKLWAKPHHDLKGWQGQSLQDSATRLSPDLAAQYEHLREQRFTELGISGTFNDFQRNALAGTYRDAWVTCELARAYLNSGDRDFTYTDSRQ